MSAHHPRAPLPPSIPKLESSLRSAASRIVAPAPLSLQEMRDQYPRRATNLGTSIRLVNAVKVGPLGQAALDAAALAHERALFHRFCLRGWLSMLAVQIRGEA